MSKKKVYYQDNQVIKEANLRILSRETIESKIENTSYRVFYFCCDREDTLMHKSIAHRIRLNSQNCRICAHIEDRENIYYQDGQVIKEANLRILSRETTGSTLEYTSYRVFYFCCNREDILMHKSIVQRKRLKSQHCRACNIHGLSVPKAPKSKKRKSPIVPPVWPVPKS